MFLTNYHATVFMHRSPDVLDNRIWVSAPVWWDQNPYVAWLYALQQAEQLSSQKQCLPRLLLPFTGASCHARPPQAKAQQEQGAMTASRKRQRPAEQHISSLASSARRTRPRTAEQHPAQHDASPGSMPERGRQSLRMQAGSDEGHEEDNQRSPIAREAEHSAGLDAGDILPLSALGEKIVELWDGELGHAYKVRHPPSPVLLCTCKSPAHHVMEQQLPAVVVYMIS